MILLLLNIVQAGLGFYRQHLLDKSIKQTDDTLRVVAEWESISDRFEQTALQWRDIAKSNRDDFLVCNSMLPKAQRMQ